MRKRNNDRVTVALIAIAAVGILSIGVTGAQWNGSGMMGGSGMMSGMMNGFVHEQGDIDWMRDMMKNNMGFTDEEFDEMAQHCPMMGKR